MARSINFNTTDMSAHGLIVTMPGFNLLKQLVSRVQLQDKGYAFTPMREPRRITVEFAVTGTSLADLDVNLDAIKKVLTLTEPKKLIFDSLPLRYYNAILESFTGEYVHGTLFRGTLAFICPDPLGYAIDPETSSPHALDVSDPKTIEEVTEGTGYIEPIYTLLATGEEIDGLIKIECINTEEELQWTGVVAIGNELEIDVANWIVKNDGVASMGTVTGRFPRLKPNTTNQIKVTGFGIKGDLTIKYRNTYL